MSAPVTDTLSHDATELYPAWLEPLLETPFFQSCHTHGASGNKSECNMYCLDCMGEALCSLCLAEHRDHYIVQVRRSSYHDVIRVNELAKVLDVFGVQTYIINSARVVFLNERPQPRPAKGVTNMCETCERSLVDQYRYCSLGCKLKGIKRHNDSTFVLQPRIGNVAGTTSIGRSVAESEEVTSSTAKKEKVKKEKSSSTTGTSSHPEIGTAVASTSASAENESPSDEKSKQMSPLAQQSSDMSPRTPPPTNTLRTKRRKGIPHRAPYT